MRCLPGMRAFLLRAAASLAALSLLPVALGGMTAPFEMTVAEPFGVQTAEALPDPTPRSSPLFDSFRYEQGQVLGTYVQFAYESSDGRLRSVLGLAGESPVLYVGEIAIDGFEPARSVTTVGATFQAQGYLVSLTAHDDPTAHIEIRTDMPRTVTIDLPASASNVSLLAATGSWPSATVSFSVGEEQGRFLLGSGSFSVSGTRLIARMMDSDLLVFKSVPPLTASRDAWRIALDAVAAGRVVAELDLVATGQGRWEQNIVRYRIGLTAWALAVAPGRATVHVDSLLPEGAVVLLGFDSDTMPIEAPRNLVVQANGQEVNRTSDSLLLLFGGDLREGGARYALLGLPGTVVALYLPTLAAITIDVISRQAAPPNRGLEPGSDVAMVAALALVCVAAARMLRRRNG